MAKVSTYPPRVLANVLGVDASGNVGLNPNIVLSYSDNGQFFANSGAIIQRLGDRAFIGAAVTNDGAFPNVSKDWLATFQVGAGLSAGTTVSAQFVSLNDTNVNSAVAGVFGSQSLHFTSSGTSGISVASIAVNNNATLATDVWAYYGEAHLTSASANSALVAEFDTRATVATITPTPYAQGNVVGLQLASGCGLLAAGQFDASAAIQVEANPMRFKKGFVFGSTALTAANGTGGNGIAIEAARGQTIRWLNSGLGVDAEIWGDTSGFHVASAGVAVASTASLSPQVTVQNQTQDANAAYYILNKVRSGGANNGTPLNGDTIGTLLWQAPDPTGANVGVASIACATNGSSGAGSIPAQLNFYIGAGQPLALFSSGVVAPGSLVSSSPAGGLGYTTGAGGTVTQITSRATTVVINKTTGAITMFSAAGSATAATFTVTNSSVAATDVIVLNQKSGTNLYNFIVTAVAAGSFNVTFYTTGGTATDAPVINFVVIKGSAN
jgi:hypothetical protein